jgi:hypothetical protein
VKLSRLSAPVGALLPAARGRFAAGGLLVIGQGNRSEEDLPNAETELEVRMGGSHADPDLLRLPRGTPPRGRGDVYRLWFPPRH